MTEKTARALFRRYQRVEAHLVQTLESANRMALHAERTMVMPKDLQLARRSMFASASHTVGILRRSKF